jgi:hypothetical protein
VAPPELGGMGRRRGQAVGGVRKGGEGGRGREVGREGGGGVAADCGRRWRPTVVDGARKTMRGAGKMMWFFLFSFTVWWPT